MKQTPMCSTLRNAEVQRHEVNTGRKQGGEAHQGSQEGRATVDTASSTSSLLSLLSRGSQVPTASPSCMNCVLQSPQFTSRRVILLLLDVEGS